ncbi:MAG: hypothetical protein K0U66_09335 [Gammaproteobacteria bacterium]|nr:hypothetical protein [Gammaproteobacteria bacterium]
MVNEIEGDQINLDNTIAELCAKNAKAGVCTDGTDKASTIVQVPQSYKT